MTDRHRPEGAEPGVEYTRRKATWRDRILSTPDADGYVYDEVPSAETENGGAR